MHKTSSNQYDKPSQVFHWLTAVAVLSAFILGPGDFGELLKNGVDPSTHSDIVWHQSLGIFVFFMTFLRLIWVFKRPTAPRFEMQPWLHFASKATHVVLWLLLFALPLSALLTLGTEGAPLTLLGGLKIETTVIKRFYFAGLADWGDVHTLLGNVIMYLAGIHALAAIYHHFVRKDKVLSSMLP